MSVRRAEDADYDKLMSTKRGPGIYHAIGYKSFDTQQMRPRVAGVKLGTFGDVPRRLTEARDEREGISGPGTYELGSLFDRAVMSSNQRSGVNSSSFANSGRQQELTPDGKNVRCMVAGISGEPLGPGSYEMEKSNRNWKHWRNPTQKPNTVVVQPHQFNQTSSQVGVTHWGTTPRARSRVMYGLNAPDSQATSHKLRRPRRVVRHGDSADAPGTSTRRGTFFGTCKRFSATAAHCDSE